jgi:hypothetical protein
MRIVIPRALITRGFIPTSGRADDPDTYFPKADIKKHQASPYSVQLQSSPQIRT